MAPNVKTETQPTIRQTSRETEGVDDAWSFLNRHHDESASGSTVDINALRRKVDWRIVPLMFGCYTMQFLDKVILNVSRTERLIVPLG